MKIKDILALPLCEIGQPFDAGKHAITYNLNGIRKHTISMQHRMYDRLTDRCFKYIEFVDICGNVTDEFWGSLNDFNIWFLGKCARGEQFFIIFYPNDPAKKKAFRVVKADAWLGSPYEHHEWSDQTFIQNDDMTWAMLPKQTTANVS